MLNNGVYYTGYTVPTDLMKQGFFPTSQFPAIYDPQMQAPFPIVSSSQGPAYEISTGNNRAPNVDNYYGNVDPRVGFSYSPNNGKTAIRGAFGITTFTANGGGIGGSLERRLRDETHAPLTLERFS
jgi:hypothetical protein